MNTRYYYFIISITILLAAASCKKSSDTEAIPEEQVLVRVGNDVITQRDFQLNYEFGFPHLMRTENKKAEYLEKMAAELVLAKEGYNHNLHTSDHIQRAVQTITEERLIEEVFQRHVISNIEISEDEIIKEVNKMAVSFEFSFLPAQSKVHAAFLKNELEEKTFDNVAEVMIKDIGLHATTSDQFRSERIPATEIDPDLLKHLKNLELNKPSAPINYQDSWFVFIVDDIVRSPLSSEDYAEKGVTARKIIYNRKAMQKATEFIANTMEPLEVETIRQPFNALAKLLYELYISQDPPVGAIWDLVTEKKESNPFAGMYAMRNRTLVVTSEKQWSVEEILSQLNAGRYSIRPDNYESFTARLADIIGLVVRDVKLLEIAEKEDYEQDAVVKRDIRKWQNKWVFREMRTKVLEGIPFNDSLVFDYVREEQFYPDELLSRHPNEFSEGQVNRFRSDYLNSKLMDEANELKNNFDVEIYYERLDTLQVSHSSANPNMTFQLLRQHNNRKPFPVLDPVW